LQKYQFGLAKNEIVRYLTLMQRFLISSEDLEVLLQFEVEPSVTAVAQAMQRDHSIVARSIKRIADKYPVVEKKSGRWALTEMGRRLNDMTRSSLEQQAGILNSRSLLSIGTNREFSAIVLAPDLVKIQAVFPEVNLSVHSYESGTEQALLAGIVDIGIDCDRPNDPEIAYKLITSEPIIVVAGGSFLKSYRKDISGDNYWTLPHLLCDRLHPDKILMKSENQIQIAARFNDVASTRAACIAGLGWAILPRYAVADKLDDGSLEQIDSNLYGKSKYGVWWARRKGYLRPSVEKIILWLEGVKL
jgi:DNA-binding transcriptional LysR family regulator